MSTTQSQKPSWLAGLLNKDEARSEAPTTTPPSFAEPNATSTLTSLGSISADDGNRPYEGEDSEPASWEGSITVGKGTLADDPMSGSIMKLLDENGFRQKIESGIQSGHTFQIIHNAPSTEFLLIEQWQENGEPRKNYQAFTIKKSETRISVTTQETLPPHPILVELRELDHDVDQLLALATRYA